MYGEAKSKGVSHSRKAGLSPVSSTCLFPPGKWWAMGGRKWKTLEGILKMEGIGHNPIACCWARGVWWNKQKTKKQCACSKAWYQQLQCEVHRNSTHISSISPPGLSLQQTELGCEALSPRINWIKINPIWNVHLILGVMSVIYVRDFYIR